jgi:hypothetical protein
MQLNPGIFAMNARMKIDMCMKALLFTKRLAWETFLYRTRQYLRQLQSARISIQSGSQAFGISCLVILFKLFRDPQLLRGKVTSVAESPYKQISKVPQR